MVKPQICAVASLLVLSCPLLSQEMKDPERAIELFEGTVQAVRSFDVSAEATMRFLLGSELDKNSYKDERGALHPATLKSRKLRADEKPESRREFSRQAYQQGKGRIEILDGPGGKPTRIATYDGEIGKSRDVPAGEALISRTVASIAIWGGDYRETYRGVLGGVTQDLLICLRERKGHVVLQGPSADSPLLTLEAEPVPGKPDIGWREWGFRLALDPRRGMMPALIEVLQPLDGKLHLYRRTTVNDWKHIGNGVWVPIKATTHIFYLDRKNKELHGEMANETVLIVDVARSSWNKGVAEEAPRLPLPSGTRVTDTERGVRYVTGKADPGKNLADLATNARKVPPMPATPPPEKKNWAGWALYGGASLAAAVVLGVGASLLWKRRWGPAL